MKPWKLGGNGVTELIPKCVYEVSRACSTHGAIEKYIEHFGRKI